MNILIENTQNDLKIQSRSIKPIVKAVLALEDISAEEVSLNFVDVETISSLHDEYFDDPSQTDCISFPLDGEEEEFRVLGEIFVCPKTAIDYAKEHDGDPYEELLLYIIHGLLHLIGLDDIDPEDREEMRRREQIHLNNLKILNLKVKRI